MISVEFLYGEVQLNGLFYYKFIKMRNNKLQKDLYVFLVSSNFQMTSISLQSRVTCFFWFKGSQ